MNAPRNFLYRWHRCEVYHRADQGWIGWARRYPDRTTDYFPKAVDAMKATRTLVDATLAESRGEPWSREP